MDAYTTDSLADVLGYLDSTTAPIVVDIETTSLQPETGRIVTVGLGAYDSDDVLVWWPSDLSELSQLRIPRMVAHHAAFELAWLRHYGAEVYASWDTMLMAHLLDEERPSYSLKALAEQILGYEPWADPDIGALAQRLDEAGHTARELEDERAAISVYQATDVMATRDLARWQRREARKAPQGADPVRVMRRILLPAITPLTMMEQARIPVDLNKLDVVYSQVDEAVAAIEHELASMLPPVEDWPDWVSRKVAPKWGQTHFTRWFLFDYVGATCPAYTQPSQRWPQGTPSLSTDSLSQVDHPVARLLVRRASLHKQLTGFLRPLKTKAREGRVSTSFKLHGTVTGRLSSASPGTHDPGINCQQIPRDKAVRGLFGQRGLHWVELDFSQLELRVGATLAGERTMLKLFRQGRDIHTYLAQQLTGCQEVTYEQRTLAKGVNFGFLYGMKAPHFVNLMRSDYGLSITRDEAEQFRERYFAEFSGLTAWYDRQIEECLAHGGVANRFGRFRHLPKCYSGDFWVREAAFRQAINSPVQSLGSDFMLISLARMARDEVLRDLGATLILSVHDSVSLTAPPSTALEVAKRGKAIMERADSWLDERFMLKADATISDYWGGPPHAEL